MSQLKIENQQCWILNYKPTFKNLVFPKHFYEKIKNFIKDKKIPTNLMLVGGSGYGKMTFLKCIMDECFNINFNLFKKHYRHDLILTYQSIFFIDFVYFKNSEFKNIAQFIKDLATKSFIQFNDTSLPKLVIFKNTHLLSKTNLTFLIAIVKYRLDNCIFICLSNKCVQSLLPYFTMIKIPYLQEKEFKSSVSKILKSHKIILKNTNINYAKMYKTYKDTFYNFKETLLWIQYYSLPSNKLKALMPIKKKMVASLLNFVLSDTSNLNSKKEITHLENIDNYIVGLIGCGIKPTEILKYVSSMLINMKAIEYEKKKEIINQITICDRELLVVEKKFFPLKKLFVNLAILFK